MWMAMEGVALEAAEQEQALSCVVPAFSRGAPMRWDRAEVGLCYFRLVREADGFSLEDGTGRYYVKHSEARHVADQVCGTCVGVRRACVVDELNLPKGGLGRHC